MKKLFLLAVMCMTSSAAAFDGSSREIPENVFVRQIPGTEIIQITKSSLDTSTPKTIISVDRNKGIDRLPLSELPVLARENESRRVACALRLQSDCCNSAVMNLRIENIEPTLDEEVHSVTVLVFLRISGNIGVGFIKGREKWSLKNGRLRLEEAVPPAGWSWATM